MTVRHLTSAEIRAIADSSTAKVLLEERSTPSPGPLQPAVPIEPDMTTPDWESWWLPEPVAAWVDAVSECCQTPKVMAIAAALCAAATLVQGKARVRINEAWEEPLSLFWLVFSPTGTGKSSVLEKAKAPIQALQELRASELADEIQRCTNERARLKSQIERMRRATKAHKYTDGAQEHMQQLRELEHELGECEVPKAPRWLFDNINPTVIPRKMRHNLEAEGVARIAVLDAEGSFLDNLLGKHTGVVDVDPLLKGYSGESIDMVRTVSGQTDTSDTHIRSAHMTALLLVQPHFLDDIRAHPKLGSNGFLGRCLMTHLQPEPLATPYRRKRVPEAVQEGYARWLATLDALPHDTVFEMPPELQSELEAIHNRIEADRTTVKGAEGWCRRALGRICRVYALVNLATQTANLSAQTAQRADQGVGVRTCVRGIVDLNYITKTLYIQGLRTAQAIEPTRSPLPSLSRRALGWFCSALSALPGSKVTLSQIRRGLTIGKGEAERLCDALVETGHLKQGAEVRSGNNRLTVEYTILSTDPLGDPKPGAFLSLLPTGAELDESPASAPDASEYLGEEDFDT